MWETPDDGLGQYASHARRADQRAAVDVVCGIDGWRGRSFVSSLSGLQHIDNIVPFHVVTLVMNVPRVSVHTGLFMGEPAGCFASSMSNLPY